MEVENQEVFLKVVSGTYLGNTVYAWQYLDENNYWRQSYKWFDKLEDCLLDFINK